jgi:hypothetical protein
MMFLGKININNIRSKKDFISIFFQFHNSVSIKNKRPVAPFTELEKYNNASLGVILEKFIILFSKNYDRRPNLDVIKRTKITKKIRTWCTAHRYGFESYNGI